MGEAVFCVSGATTAWVTKASPNVGVGTAVCVATSVANRAAVCVAVGAGEEVGGMPPSGVGVEYCPHREVLPPQEASRNEAVIKKLISLFTK